MYDVRGDQCIICTGTSTERPGHLRAEIHHLSREGKSLGLINPTYFYESGFKRFAVSQLSMCGGSAKFKIMVALDAVFHGMRSPLQLPPPQVSAQPTTAQSATTKSDPPPGP